MRRIQCVLSFVLSLVLVFLTGCLTPEDPTLKDPKAKAENFYQYFDTLCAVLSYAGDSEEVFAENAELVRASLERYHQIFDIYNSYVGVVNLHTLNKKAKDAPVAVSDELFAFLVYAKGMYNLTGGVVNIAMGAVLSVWHEVREDAESNPDVRLPDKAQLDEAKLHTNINDLILDEQNKTVYFADPQMKLDVGALAKGYATEQIGIMLEERGVTSYVLNFGGNIRAIGTRPSGAGWITGITNPDKTSEKAFAVRIILKDVSLVTSGDYERYFVKDGVRYHHIIDPKTNYPAAYFSSISIHTDDSALADALSTALFCMSYEDGKVLVDSLLQKGVVVDVLWIDADGGLKMTDGFREILCDE